MNIEDYNFAGDPRNCELAKPPILYLEDGTEMELPTTWGVCDVCKGAGKHVNPSIDASGISPEQFHDDPDFAEDYFGGVYDVPCNSCGGRTTVKVVDWDALTADEKRQYEQQLADDAANDAQCLAEIRAGA